jgi:type II secretion system protein D
LFDLQRFLAVVAFCSAVFGPVARAQEEPSVTFQFEAAPLPFILSEYEKLTGKRIVRDAATDSATLSLETSVAMTRAEAAEFLEKSLLLNGFVLLPSGPDTVKVVSEGKVPRSEGAPVVLHPEDLPEGDQVVTYVMRLRHVRGQDVLEAFRTIAPNHSYGEIAVLPDGVTLAITDNSAVIRRYLELQEFVDAPVAEQISRAFDLERAHAVEVVEQLEKLLEPDPESPAVAAAANVPPPGAAAAAVPAPPRAVVSRPRIAAIERTNKILALAHPVQMVQIEELVREFDAAAAHGNQILRVLHYLPVLDFLPIARDSLTRGRGEEAGSADVLNPREPRSRTSPGFNAASPSGDPAGTGGFGSFRESLEEPEETGGPKSLVVGHTLLIADPSANELFAAGPPEQLLLIGQLLDQLDKKPRQIFISTVIGQLTLDDRFNLGLDFLRTVDGFNVGGDPVQMAGSFRTRTAGPILDVGTLTNVAAFGNAIPAGLTVYGQIGDHLQLVLDALERTSRFTVLSRPSVFTLNNQKAVIQTGERIAVPVNTLAALNTGTLNPSVASTIQFQDVVLRLEVIPLINSRDEVTLKISQVNDDIVGSTFVSGNEIPTIGTQEMRTTVIIPNKSTVLLGGLISDDRRDSNGGLPVLTRIPVVKHLAGNTSRSTVRQELLIFIQPQIVEGDVDLAEAGADTLDRTELSQDALEFATSPQTPVLAPPATPAPAPPAETAPSKSSRPGSRWGRLQR